MTDTTSMTGAEFREHVGTDAAKWADACFAAMRAHAASGDVLDGPSRAAFLAQWFRDYGEAVRSEAAREAISVCCSLPPRAI
jgi:hypothetical protein